MYNIEDIILDIKNSLSDFRYEHSLLVANEAKKLAKHYGCDENKAYIAGLVHDIAKEFSEEDNKKWIKNSNIKYDISLPEFSKIAHADIGAIVAKVKYNLDDEICNAIKYHTIGNEDMTTFDKIIFIADKIGRKNKNSFTDELSSLAYENLDKAIITYIKRQKEKLESKGEKLHPDTILLLNKIDK